MNYIRYAINDSLWNSEGSYWQAKEFMKFLKDSKTFKAVKTQPLKSTKVWNRKKKT